MNNTEIEAKLLIEYYGIAIHGLKGLSLKNQYMCDEKSIKMESIIKRYTRRAVKLRKYINKINLYDYNLNNSVKDIKKNKMKKKITLLFLKILLKIY